MFDCSRYILRISSFALIPLLLLLWLGPGCSGQTNPPTTGDAETSNAVHVTEKTFPREVEHAAEPLVLVDVWATWCAPCKVIAPHLEKLAGEYKGRVKLCKVDAEQNHDLLKRFSVGPLPTVLLFKDGSPIGRKVGKFPESTYRQWIEMHL
jgi:thioredoxin